MPANVKFFSPFFFGSGKNAPTRRALENLIQILSMRLRFIYAVFWDGLTMGHLMRHFTAGGWTWCPNEGPQNPPSRKLTHPQKMPFWRWFSFFPRWDMLIPWRVSFFFQSTKMDFFFFGVGGFGGWKVHFHVEFFFCNWWSFFTFSHGQPLFEKLAAYCKSSNHFKHRSFNCSPRIEKNIPS